jgi:hypothetical protein
MNSSQRVELGMTSLTTCAAGMPLSSKPACTIMSKVRINNSSDLTHSEVQGGTAVGFVPVGFGVFAGFVFVHALVIYCIECREVGALVLGGGIILGQHCGGCYRGEREKAQEVHNGQMIDLGQVENC